MDQSTQLQVFRELGSMDARIGNIESDVSEVKADMRLMKASLETLLERSAKDRGGRAVLWKVGGASATGGGLLVSFLQWFRGPH